MTTIKALYKVTSDTYAAFEARNYTYQPGILTFISSGAHAGRMKIGDGITGWNSLPFLVPQATESVLGLIKSSTTRLYGHVNANGALSINGLEAELASIREKDTEQDSEISAVKQQLEGMSGTIIYIGGIDEYTSALTAMNAADRDALLTARAVELRGRVMDGYTLQDLGIAGEPGRFHYWQHQPDGTWFDLGERGEVSQATDTDLGIVMGSGAEYKIHIELDGTMSVNGLTAKLEELDSKDGELGEGIEALEGRLEESETAQAEVNGNVEEEIESINKAAETLSGAFDSFKEAQEKNNLEQQEAIGEAKANANGRIAKDIFSDTNSALVADMAVMPEAGSLANIRKTLKNVGGRGNYDIDVHVKSEDGSLTAEFGKADDHNYTLNLETADKSATDAKIGERALEDGGAAGTLVSIAAKTLTAWLQGIRDNLKHIFNSAVFKTDTAGFFKNDGTVGYPTAANVGLENVNNTSDLDKPVSTAQAAAIAEAGLGGGAGQIEEALPPLFADRDGFLVCGRGGVLIELHIPEPLD